MIQAKLTKEYISNKNVLDLCYSKILNKNILDLIKLYLIEYKHGLALFNNKSYTINNEIIHKNLGGHPFPSIIRFISKYNYFNNTNLKFNKILNDINKTPNHLKIDLIDCINFLILNKLNITELSIPCTPDDILLTLVQYIDNTNNYYNTMVYYKLHNNHEIIKFNCLYLIINRNLNILEEILIKNSNYSATSNFYTKNLIKSSNIITFNINRSNYDDIHGLRFNKHKLIIPKILDLPEYVFYNNDKNIYILIGIILYDKVYDNIYGYSIVIRKNNNKYYHYSFNNIYIIDNDFFEQKINYNATNLFYKQI